MQPTDRLAGLTQSRLKELLAYDPATGEFSWLVAASRRVKAGQRAGSLCVTTGYRMVKVDGRDYLAHRLAFLFMTGEWPEDRLDHENLNKADNRWANLRPATFAENIRNRGVQKNTQSGLKGVHFAPTRTSFKKWAAHIRIDGVLKTLGYFANPEDAHAAYAQAATENFGQFARI